MHFIAEYGMFLAKTITAVLAVLIILAAIASKKGSQRSKQEGEVLIKRINETFTQTKDTLDKTLSKSTRKQLKKQRNKAKKTTRPRLFIVHFNGDKQASQVDALRQQVTAILLSAQPQDRVLVCLESPGGMVANYGLAASQLCRIKQADIPLTVAVDKVAASGGYLMACIADTIIAAPFAILGSIGVVLEMPNFNRFLHHHHVDFEQQTAGDYKRTLSLLGKNTKESREKMQEQLEQAHSLFKQHVKEHRPQVELSEIATGEHWFGLSALKLQLIDKIQTSDDFILSQRDQFGLFEVQYQTDLPLLTKILKNSQTCLQQLRDENLLYIK